MQKTLSAILHFFKNNFIFTIAMLIAMISCFFVPIDKGYLNYFEWDTITCIFLLLLVIAGLTNIDFFQKVARFIIKKFKNTRSIIMCLIFITYVMAIFNANDMSLLTLLPLSYIVLKYTNNLKYCAFTFIMQNIASNLGGMIVPIGNPQNLYIYSYYNVSIWDFLKVMILPTLIALILIIIVCLFIKKEPLKYDDNYDNTLNKTKTILYFILFGITLLLVFRIIPFWIALIVVTIAMLFIDRKAFLKVDYTIPLTFVAFFIFSGNMSRIPALVDTLVAFVNKDVYLTAYVSCQLISNVPTAVLLSKFTTNWQALLVSVNVASLGIIFSSLSGVIALKEYIKVASNEKLGKNKGEWYYIGLDLLFNVVGAVILYPLARLTLLLW